MVQPRGGGGRIQDMQLENWDESGYDAISEHFCKRQVRK
jgi:hypothetical protein